MFASGENSFKFNRTEQTLNTKKPNEVLHRQLNTPTTSEVLDIKIDNVPPSKPNMDLSHENSLLHLQLMKTIKEMIIDSVKELKQMVVKPTPQPKEDKVMVTGMELVPYVAPKDFTYTTIIANKEALIKELKETMVEEPTPIIPLIIKDGILVEVPITVDYTDDISSILWKDKVKTSTVERTPVQVRPLVKQTPELVVRQKRMPTTQVATINKSFTFPEKFLDYAAIIDKIPVAQLEGQSKPVTQNERRFTIFERLDGWHIERRQRTNGRYDTFYRHRGTKVPLRSTTEVANFIVFETIPDKKQKGTAYENSLAQGRTSHKRKSTSVDVDRKGKAKVGDEGKRTDEKFFVHKFLNSIRIETTPLVSPPHDYQGFLARSNKENLFQQQVKEFLKSSRNNMDYDFNNDGKVPKETKRKRKRARKLQGTDFNPQIKEVQTIELQPQIPFR